MFSSIHPTRHKPSVFALTILFILTIVLQVSAVIAAPSAETVPVTMTCPFSSESGGDQITRGFYITDFPGNRLNTVTLRYYPLGATSNIMNLVARLNTYDGEIIGIASASADFTVEQTVTFDFGGAIVPVNSLITFANIPDGYVEPPWGYLFYDVGAGPCPGFTETDDTSAPLGSYRRDSMGAIITGSIDDSVCGSVPSGSVVGSLPANTQAYYEPGNIANGVVINAGTYWVIGVDESGEFYKIVLGCQYLWVPVNTMQPSYQSPWNGEALPTRVVS